MISVTAPLEDKRNTSPCDQRAIRVCRIQPTLDVVVSAGTPSTEPLVDTGDLLGGYDGFKTRWCHRYLRVINEVDWLPERWARFPLRVCRNEIGEGLMRFDPDAVDVSQLRWGRELHRLLSQAHPQWHWLLTGGDGVTLPNDPERRWNPKVSIVLPTYNGVTYLRQSIESCLNQTYRNIELLVVDDGSDRDIGGICRSYSDPRVRYLRHATNRGLSAALNTGFRESTGTFLTWTSDDNYYVETAIETMAAFLGKYPDVAFVYAPSTTVNEGVDGWTPQLLGDRPASYLGRDNCVGGCFLYRRRVYEIVGEYDSGFNLAEDYDYWIRVASRFRMQRLARQLYYYRFHRQSLTSNHRPEMVRNQVRRIQRGRSR